MIVVSHRQMQTARLLFDHYNSFVSCNTVYCYNYSPNYLVFPAFTILSDASVTASWLLFLNKDTMHFYHFILLRPMTHNAATHWLSGDAEHFLRTTAQCESWENSLEAFWWHESNPRGLPHNLWNWWLSLVSKSESRWNKVTDDPALTLSSTQIRHSS